MASIIVPVDDYSPIVQGDTANPFIIRVLHKNGYQDLTGATITMKMQSASDPTIVKTCVGPWIIDPVNTYKASYTYQANDVNTDGSWYMRIKIVKNGIVHPDDGEGDATPKILVIKPLQSGL